MLTEDLIKVTPSPETLISMLADKPLPAACISDIPATSAISIEPVPHHHHPCRDCRITLACFEQDCTKTGDTCHECATSCERPTWSASDELRRHRARQAEIARRQLIEMLVERLEGLTHMELVRVASFINEVEGR